MEKQIKRIQIMRKVNSILFRNVFAHHPNCSEYDHHVLKVDQWRFCLGCTAMYIFIVITALIDLLLAPVAVYLRFTVGILFFLPAVFQLKLKSNSRPIRFLLRSSLGVSIYCLISFLVLVNPWWVKLLAILIFILGIRLYSNHQAGRQLRECDECSLGEEFTTCLIKFQDFQEVEDLELISEQIPQVNEYLNLKQYREKLINLPLKDDPSQVDFQQDNTQEELPIH